MSRCTYVMRNGELVEKHLAPPPEHSGPYVISDNMDYVQNHADGQHYDSKRAFEKAVRRAGCEIVGNDQSMLKPREFQPVITRQDVKDTLDQMRSRRS
jgi:hypothetical protein